MGQFSIKLFNAALIFASFFFLVNSISEEQKDNSKSLLSSKLQTIVSKLGEIITRLDPNSVVLKTPRNKSPGSGDESTAKTRPSDVCPPAEKCPPLPGCTKAETSYTLSMLSTNKQFVQSKKQEACGKIYDFHINIQDIDQAQKLCCNNNLTLLSLDSLEEVECVKQIYKLERSPPKLMWTSGRIDKACSAGYSWCSQTASTNVGQIVPWKDGGPDASKGNCVAVDMTNLDKLVLINVKCITKLRYICESRIF